MKKRKLVLYIAMSLDGVIAKPGDDLSFLLIVHKEGEDYGYTEFLDTVDTVIIGRKTFDWVMKQVGEFPHSDLDTYVVTRSEKASFGNISFYTGKLKDLVSRLKNEPGKDIFCDGGAELVNELLKERLIDEMIISIIPIAVGDGTRLFGEGRPEQKLELISVRQFDTGLVQLHYSASSG